jgi:hypothetical protein
MAFGFCLLQQNLPAVLLPHRSVVSGTPSGRTHKGQRIEDLYKSNRSEISLVRSFPSWDSVTLQSIEDKGSVVLAHTHPACRSTTPRFSLCPLRSFRGAKKPLLSWVYFPFRGFTDPHTTDGSLPPCEQQESFPGNPHELFRLFSACSCRDLYKKWRGCQLPQKPTRSVFTLPADRSSKPSLQPIGFLSPRKRS